MSLEAMWLLLMDTLMQFKNSLIIWTCFIAQVIVIAMD